MELRPIAHIRTGFPEKFGIPRQSGVVKELRGRVVFGPEYRAREAFRGIEGFSHLWLIWGFSKNPPGKWSPTVRPPRLGGNRRVGVFASRSPFRPNPLGLSCVELCGVDYEGPEGPVLVVKGADMADGTPIYDVKPYLPGADSIEGARGGFTDQEPWEPLSVDCPPELLNKVPPGDREALLAVLAADPRPHYHRDPERVYGMGFAGVQVRFTVGEGRVRVVEIVQ
ncbi:tRNA (N6-threonylcarbamoyladenosine(37)-N6)-methyltransferase TrmO [Acutalibacter muris]|uniref:tRNA (N6-threonylcarbamoyladenosine(37)-N6)-methyltransferase TrmO n=1 Tax=Acutalibacter muris TaxID=1796620 RepID=A0A1Z2XT38_9FIRM|nr:tRNA (N6-threonylcarbamoyladenosine(37)-N6)-methyltransferase TrmO [Acutalibacter muris]ANU55154.1 tRNA (N6-threonylcarbamoyladenosine(37)-N6)-methyltransferase TrmO [Hungateiclostridiaceae bacterium KB18]ASB41613.1 tRNA (N6-threonylcarbamoyladenosine(37)-N6)-methyltransferase TrmO [Acutalibacter muris]QQR30872.1 tRNA (N6-threonylcarbamoyladenosine(37)-N6)-methyltransferase TrmO [Acutalibacter muris]